jgi:cation/acetate symporter
MEKTILLCQLGLLNGKLQVLTFEDKNGDGKIQYYNDNSRTQHFSQEAKGNKGSN